MSQLSTANSSKKCKLFQRGQTMAQPFHAEKAGYTATFLDRPQRMALAAIAAQDRQTPSGVLRDLVDREARSRGLLKEQRDATQRPA